MTRTVVAATKLAVPRWRRPLVPRPELSARLSGDYRLGLVSAPAGYGKTATLAEWASARRDDVAWLSCDPSDAEPTRFMTCLLSAISTTWPGLADDAFVLLERDGANTYDAAVAVANELAAADGPGAIVVDDLHLAAPAPALLTAFVDALPNGFRFVAGTRSDPPLSLSRFRLRGELLELRGHDLRFVPTELSHFMGLHDVALAGDALLRLHELTEGWPAGAQLAAIALQRGTGSDDFLEAFASTDRAVSDFLLSEVLGSLPPDLVDFLTATSVLESFDADLCAAVTGTEDAAVVLDHLLAANLFLVPLDDRARWYRYHHLFGSFLRARLASLGSSKLRAAHDRACRALEDRGDVGGALHQAMSMGDVDRAGRIVRAAVGRTASVSDGADVTILAVRRWLHELGAEFVVTDPIWVVEFLIGLIALSRPDDAPAWLQRVRDAHPDADGELVALLEGAWGEHRQSHGQPLEAIRHARLAMDALGGAPPNRSLLPLIYTTSARAHIQAGRFDDAGSVLDHGLAHPVGSPIADEVRNRGVAAFAAAVTGELSRARDLATRCVEAADRLELSRHEPGRIYAGLAMVESHLELIEDERARQVLDEVKQAADASRRVTLQSIVTLWEAKTARLLGDEAGAAALLDQARLHYLEPDAALRHVLAEEAVAQALRFDPSKAAPLLADLDPGRVETPALRARVALARHEHPAAAELLAGLPPATNRRARVEREVLWALSLRERDVERANAHLHAAVVAAQPEWLVRTIIGHDEVHKLLVSFTPEAEHAAFVHALLVAADSAVAPVRTEAAATLVDPLSARELTVLRYLCSRLTYQEIAAALYVSLNTLKSHVRAVYRKLDVASRADAVDTGRRLGLV